MPEDKPGADVSLFVLKPKDGDPRLRLQRLVAGFDRRRKKAERKANKQLVREAFGKEPEELPKKP